jgi:hypothetical protein
VTLLCRITINICCSGKCKQLGCGLISGGRAVWAKVASTSVTIFNSSCAGNGGPRLSAWPSTQKALKVEKDCRSANALRATLATSASGFVLSKTLIFSYFQVAVMDDLLSHTCSMLGGEKPYTLPYECEYGKCCYVAAYFGSIRYDVLQSPVGCTKALNEYFIVKF